LTHHKLNIHNNPELSTTEMQEKKFVLVKKALFAKHFIYTVYSNIRCVYIYKHGREPQIWPAR